MISSWVIIMGEDKKELLRKKPGQRMPDNLEAVYENGVFIGRKVKAPHPSTLAQTPEDYLKIIHDENLPVETRNDAIVHYFMFFRDNLDAFFASPQKPIFEVIQYDQAERLMFFISQLAEFTDKRVIEFRKKCCAILKKHPKVKPWMVEEIQKK